MKKLWNHCDPLVFSEDDVSPVCEKQPAAKKKRFKLFSWLLGALENSSSSEDEPAIAYEQLQAALAERKQRAAQVNKALQDWKAATAFFESVTEPELIDYAVYGVEAAQKRYIYLLKNSGSYKEQRDISV